jgi:hypothetical protein
MIPTLYANGTNDDGPALQAILDGKPYQLAAGLPEPEITEDGLLLEGLSLKIKTRVDARGKRGGVGLLLVGCNLDMGGKDYGLSDSPHVDCAILMDSDDIADLASELTFTFKPTPDA